MKETKQDSFKNAIALTGGIATAISPEIKSRWKPGTASRADVSH